MSLKIDAYLELCLTTFMFHLFHLSSAHELGAWLLHYSIAVLYQILPDDYYQHHLLLVDGIYLLLKDEVYPGDVKQSERLLRHYCFLFGAFYGKNDIILEIVVSYML